MCSTCTYHCTVLKYCGPFSDEQRINCENTLTKLRPTHAAAKAETADVIRFSSSSMWEHTGVVGNSACLACRIKTIKNSGKKHRNAQTKQFWHQDTSDKNYRIASTHLDYTTVHEKWGGIMFISRVWELCVPIFSKSANFSNLLKVKFIFPKC